METFEKWAEPGREWALAVEAAGLRWLAEAEHSGGARVVQVLESSPVRLVLERLASVAPSVADAEAFGRALFATHSAGAAAFGSCPPGVGPRLTIGSADLQMGEHDTFGEYAAERMILPFAHAAGLPSEGMRVVARLADRLAGGDFDDHLSPARIHGDLWAGNVMWTADGAVLIDPAAHGGHPLTDLSMLALFGASHLERIHSAYEEVADLPSDWRELIPLHQVWPLLVHAHLFGGGYTAQAVAVARSFN